MNILNIIVGKSFSLHDYSVAIEKCKTMYSYKDHTPYSDSYDIIKEFALSHSVDEPPLIPIKINGIGSNHPTKLIEHVENRKVKN